MATNRALYLRSTGAPLEVGPAPYPTPADDEVIIRNRALAINPVDHAIQKLGPEVFKFITLPAILGYDVAGEVEVVGKDVTRFKPGDRVAGLAQGGAQEHVPLSEHLTILLPESVTFTQGSVLPMGISVATKALFHEETLAASLPTSPRPNPKNETILIWGGATSMSTCAIQLAVAAGYDVITTTSPRNFDHARRLGASQVFDYASPTVREDLLAAFRGRTVAGALANAAFDSAAHAELVETCAMVVASCPGKKVVVMTMVPTWGPKYEGVVFKFLMPLRGATELASAVFHDYVPGALRRGDLLALPEAEVVGRGLESVQKAMDVLAAGVSAKKIVVEI